VGLSRRHCGESKRRSGRRGEFSRFNQIQPLQLSLLELAMLAESALPFGFVDSEPAGKRGREIVRFHSRALLGFGGEVLRCVHLRPVNAA